MTQANSFNPVCKSLLLSLPAEIRTQIWVEYLALHHATYCNEHYAVVFPGLRFQHWCPCTHNNCITNSCTSFSLRSTCQQIHHELINAFRDRNAHQARQTAFTAARAIWQTVIRKYLPEVDTKHLEVVDNTAAYAYRRYVVMHRQQWIEKAGQEERKDSVLVYRRKI